MKKVIVALTLSSFALGSSASAAVDLSLINAAKRNDVNTVYNLLNPKTINYRDAYGNTALSYGLRNNNYQIVNMLLANGANPMLRDSSRDFIFCSALNSPNAGIRYLFSNYNPQNCSSSMLRQNTSNTTYNKAPASSRVLSSSSFSAGSLGLAVGGVAVVGGGLALAFSGGGGSDNKDSGSSGGSSNDSYNYVGQVNQASLNSILNNSQYNGIWSTGLTGNISNSDDFNEIRLAYSLARGYTGAIDTSPDTPYFMDEANARVEGSGNVKVAVLDTGVQANHQDLANNIVNPSANANLAVNYCSIAGGSSSNCAISQGTVNNPSPISDENGFHGTAVAGVIAAEDNSVGSIGIAPDAEILPFKVTFNNASFVPNYYLGEAIAQSVIDGASVINNSYGVDASSTISAATPANYADGAHLLSYMLGDKILSNSNGTYFENNSSSYSSSASYNSNYINQMINSVTNNDVIYVFAAGNDGYSQSTINTSIPLYYNEFYDNSTGFYKNFVNVVNYNTSSGALDSSSNQCGVTMNYCITAPGTNLVSTSYDSSNPSDNAVYASVSGTSFAAPMVSGAIAVLQGAFPYLTGAEITKLLFVTARDLGAVGVDEVYGWGMLDLERATRPVGATIIPVDNNIAASGYSTLSSSIKLNPAMAYSIAKQNLSFVMVDSFNRTYQVSMNDFIASENNRTDMEDALQNFAPQTKKVSLNKSNNLSLAYTSSSDNGELVNKEMQLSYSDTKDDYKFNMYYGDNPYKAFINDKYNFYSSYTLASIYGYNPLNPYFATDSEENFAFSNSFKLSDKATFTFGLLQQNYTMDYDDNDAQSVPEELGSSMSMIAGASYDITDNATTTLELGLINEESTLFGTSWAGAFGLGEDNITYTAGIQSDINLFNNKLSLIGKANLGYTKVNTSKASLVKNASNIVSQSYAIGANYNFDRNENLKSNLSFLVSQPLKITSGKFDLSLPHSRDVNGNIYYNDYGVALNSPTETNYQLVYNHQIDENSSFNFGASYKDYIEDELVVLFKYTTSLGGN